MEVDLQADLLLGESELIEHHGVGLGRQHVPGHRVGRRLIEQLGGQLSGDHVGRVVGVGRDLDSELSLRAERSGPGPDHPPMIGDPLERGVGEDDVVGVRLPTNGRCRRART